MFLRKRWMVVAALMFRYFIAGLEYSVILPTIVVYMRAQDAGILLTGIAISMYPLGTFICVYIVQLIYKHTKRFKELFLLFNFFEIIGNIIYSLPYSKWLPVVGRFVAGFGASFFTLSAPQIIHMYSDTDHFKIISAMHFSRVAGLIVGPALNYAFRSKYISFETWTLTSGSLPAVCLALLWLLMEIVTLIFVSNNFNDKDKLSMNYNQLLDEGESSSSYKSRDTSLIYTDDFENNDNESSEDENENSNPPDESKRTMGQKCQNFLTVCKELLSLEYFSIVLVDLTLWFSQSIFEVLAIYIGELKFGWDPSIMSGIIIAGGIVILVICSMIYFVDRIWIINEVHLTIFSLVFTHVALTFLVFEETMPIIAYVLFGTMYAFVFLAIPLNAFAIRGLLTKMFPEDLGKVACRISTFISWLAVVAGPVLSSVLYKYRVYYGAVCSIFSFFVIVFFLLMIGRVNEKLRKSKKIE